MRCALINDTSSYHSGSAAVMRCLRQVLESLGWSEYHVEHSTTLARTDVPFSAIAGADAVIINGEGTLWGQSHKRAVKSIMRLADQAKESGKRVALVNAQWEVWDEGKYTPTLGKLDFIHTREYYSHKRLTERGIVSITGPDLCTGLNMDPSDLVSISHPHAVMVGKAYRFPIAKQSEDIDLNEGAWDLYGYSLPISKNQEWESVLKTLHGAKVYVTGQHHGVYAAMMANVPVVAVPTMNSKLEALQDFAVRHGWFFPLANNPEDMHRFVASVDEWALPSHNIVRYCRMFHKDVFTRCLKDFLECPIRL